MPIHERGSPIAVLRVLQTKEPTERLRTVTEADTIYKLITMWAYTWRRYGWAGESGLVGHADVWQQIYALLILLGDTLTLIWALSHVEIEGNEEAGKLAEQGRWSHPYNERHASKRQCGLQGKVIWQEPGLEEIQSEAECAQTTPSQPTPGHGFDLGTHVL